MTNLCSNEHSKMSFELLETIQVTQKNLPPKLANKVSKVLQISTYDYHSLITQGRFMQGKETDRLLYGQTINYRGWLHSNEYRRNVLANNITAQVIMDEKRNLFLHINQTPIAQWFKEQLGLGQNLQVRRKI